jgi:rubredoxin
MINYGTNNREAYRDKCPASKEKHSWELIEENWAGTYRRYRCRHCGAVMREDSGD